MAAPRKALPFWGPRPLRRALLVGVGFRMGLGLHSMVGWWIMVWMTSGWQTRQAVRQSRVGESVNLLGGQKQSLGTGYDGPWSASLWFWEEAVPLLRWTRCVRVCRHVWLACLFEASCSRMLACDVRRCWFEYSGLVDLLFRQREQQHQR